MYMYLNVAPTGMLQQSFSLLTLSNSKKHKLVSSLIFLQNWHMFLITDLTHGCNQGFINGHPQIGIGANSPIPKQGLGASTSLNSFKEVNVLLFFCLNFSLYIFMYQLEYLKCSFFVPMLKDCVHISKLLLVCYYFAHAKSD